jgi:hypothetical protein
MVGGQTYIEGSPGDNSFTLQRVSPTGNLIWSRVYNNIVLDVNGSFLLPLGNDEFVLAGTAKLPDRNDDISLMKVNGQGDTLWTSLAGGDSDDCLSSIKLTSDGGFIAVGFITGSDGPISFSAKIDSMGDLVWQHTYPEPVGRWGTLFLDVALAEDGGYLIGGATWVNAVCQLCMVRTTSVGDTLWTRNHEQDSLVQINGILPVAGGDFMLTGIRGQAFENGCLFLARATFDGQLAWVHTYACGNATPVSNFLGMPDGGYILNGTTYQDHGEWADFDAVLIRTDQFGNEQFECTYGNSGYQSGDAAVVTHDGTIVLAGVDTTSVGDENVFLIRTEPVLAAHGVPGMLPQSICLLGNYPNPFNTSTVIKFELAKAGDVTLRVFDVLGREAATLIDEVQTAGGHAVPWDARAMSSGVYFAVLRAGGRTVTKKMLMLK